MSEEKLYAVKNDDGIYWDFYYVTGFWSIYLDIADCPITTSKKQAEEVAHDHCGHVVTFIEEPKKVVLTKEQAEIVEGAHNDKLPACYISSKSGEEDLLMNAYVNGYTVEKEKRYLVELDGLITTDGAKQYLTKKNGKWFASRRMSGLHQDFTDEELNKAPKWAQQLDREEVAEAEIENYGFARL